MRLFFARTTVPISQAPLTPAELRNRLRPIREDLQQLIAQLMWDERYGECCQLLQRAELNVIAARDSSHQAEPLPMETTDAGF